LASPLLPEITVLLIMVDGQLLKQAKAPLLLHKPFIVVWNAPTEQCRLRYKVDLDLNVFDIASNTNETLSGSNVTIFYHTHLGHYPYYLDNGVPINGGVPQNESLIKHLNKAKSDIDHSIPLKKFQGLAVIDWENWRPQWDRNWGNKTIYRNKSLELVRRRHPQWSEDKIRKVAKEEFENAGKSFMNNTILLAEHMRPNGLWGYYLYPDCYNYDYKEHPKVYTGRCPDIESSRNDLLLWLWKESTALYPSIYLDYILKSSPNALKFVHYRVKEAIRIASVARKDYVLPVFVYSRPFYAYTLHVLTEASELTTGPYIHKSPYFLFFFECYPCGCSTLGVSAALLDTATENLRLTVQGRTDTLSGALTVNNPLCSVFGPYKCV
uniref:Hyaluronidase n=1 Tax=Gopherus agassizii TaxID=38772 RepID=A0A452GZW4_9SAUR